MNLSILESMVAKGDLSLDAVRYLLVNCRGECEWLDYKEALHLDSDKGAADFTRDALAMKNTGGGFLLVGVKDKTWEPIGLDSALSYDTKLLRDKIRRCSGIELDVHIVHHTLDVAGKPRVFSLILVRSSRKRKRRRMPTLVKSDFCPTQPFGLRRGEIFVRKGDSTVRVQSQEELEQLLDDLEDQSDRDALDVSGAASPFAVQDGTYRLLEKGFETLIGRDALRQDVLQALECDPRIWIINVHGPGGVGKSAIVNWVTYNCYERKQFEAILQLTGKETILTFDGIRRFSRSLYSLEDLVERILETFQESTAGDSESNRHMALEILTAWKTLLVLDNMETVTDGRILQFVQSIPPGAKSKVLMTSRTKTGGWEYAIPVCELSLPEMREFVEAKCADMGVTFPDKTEIWEQVHEATGGLPLAIQWMIGRYKTTGSLQSVLGAVRSPDSPVLEFSFRNIWNGLSPDSRAILCVLTVFDAPPTVQNIAIATEWPIERISRAMGELTDATMATRTIRQGDGQIVYVALPITLSFALHQFHILGDFESQCRQRVNRFSQQMALVQSETQRFASVFERYGLESENEKKAAILCNRGQSEVFSGNMDGAEKLFQQAREMAPNSAYAFAMSASFELARQSPGVALKHALKACELATKKSGSLTYSILAQIHDAERNKVARVTALEKAVEYDASNVIIRHQYGVALSRVGRTQEAVSIFSAIIEEEAKRSPPRETLLMAIKTRVINYRRLGLENEAAQDIVFAEKILTENPHLQTQARHIVELKEDGS